MRYSHSPNLPSSTGRWKRLVSLAKMLKWNSHTTGYFPSYLRSSWLLYNPLWLPAGWLPCAIPWWPAPSPCPPGSQCPRSRSRCSRWASPRSRRSWWKSERKCWWRCWGFHCSGWETTSHSGTWGCCHQASHEAEENVAFFPPSKKRNQNHPFQEGADFTDTEFLGILDYSYQ